MNIPEFIKMAKMTLNEDAGSEGMKYIVEAKSGLAEYDDNELKIKDLKEANGITSGKVTFTYPHDYGFALNTLKRVLPGLDLTSLKLIY